MSLTPIVSNETWKDQIGLTAQDFLRLPDVVENYDSVQCVKDTKAGLPGLLYTKTYQDDISYWC